MSFRDVVIVGAGPYGLSAAAHMATIKGLDVHVFGDPMSFWDQNMPAGMFLRSNWTATQIASPESRLSLEAFQAERKISFSMPVPLEAFVQYGLWYQKAAVSGVDRRPVARVEQIPGGFRVTPSNGEAVESRRVVIAAGIGSFARWPEEFRHLMGTLATHASEHRDLGVFRGKSVIVIGSGQSALESAALLHEQGASVQVIGRATRIHWLQGSLSKFLHHGAGRGMRKLLYAPTDVGPAGLSQLMARPDLLRYLPRGLKDKLRRRCVRPAGARWLVDRLKPVPISLGRSVVSAKASGSGACIRLDDGTERTADHLLLGTGYRVDVTKYSFLSDSIRQTIRQTNGFPILQSGFETSVPRLHILGAPAAWSFGPLMQFVSGTTYASRALVHLLTENSRSSH